ncbi:hypothetical protein [Thomasclavelia cocleata]|uniref:hypothetical protein n=1 Tax=Thomasclavelia cocleata TaxID=69824 RepID=UPI00242AD8DA|nr:hypothetical protein [Thomasclavelia cocleata]
MKEYKLYDVFNSRDKKVLTGTASVCCVFMGFSNKHTFYDYVKRYKKNNQISNAGYYAKESTEKINLEKEVTAKVKGLTTFVLNKNLLVPQELGNGLKRLTKIKKGKKYLYDKDINRNSNIITLAVKITRVSKTKKKYRDVLKIPREEFNLYFRRKD